MIKRIAAITSVIIILLLFALPAYAFDPLDPTDNASAQYVFTDNFSIQTDNFTITFGGPLTFSMDLTSFSNSLNEGILAGADEIADQLGTLSAIWILFVFLFGLAVLAYIGKDRGLFLLAGLGFVVYGFTFISTSLVACILMVLAGIFIFLRAFSSKGRE